MGEKKNYKYIKDKKYNFVLIVDYPGVCIKPRDGTSKQN